MPLLWQDRAQDGSVPEDAGIVSHLRIRISCCEGLPITEESAPTGTAAAAAEGLYSGTTSAESTRDWSSSCGTFSASESGLPAEAGAAEADAAEEANVHAYSGRGGG